MKRLLVPALLISLVWHGGTQAESLRPFVSGSAAAIREAHAGRPYILTLWSLGCTHCAEELKLLGQLLNTGRTVSLVLVSTDSPTEREALAARLRQHGLEQAENWVFADDFSERLRHEIDPRWGGELPRSYLVSRDRTARAISGRLDRLELESWITAQ